MSEILIDTYKLKEPYSGLGQFSLNFARQVAVQKSGNLHMDFLIPKGFDEKTIDSEGHVRFVHTDLQKRYFPFLNKKYDIWHSLHQFPSFHPGRKTSWILTIHDLNFLIEKNAQKAERYLKRLQADADRAACITTISEYSRGQIEKHLDLKGKKVEVIYNGVAPNPDPAELNHRPAFVKEGKFFFSIGIFNRKKNFHILLPLMHYFGDHQLIIAGDNNTAYGREVQAEIKKLGLEKNVVLPGKVSDVEKYWLHNHCRAFLFPSLAEGFGIPVIEAMKAGKPVFLSRHTALPEIGGDKAFYFEDFSEEGMIALIGRNLKEFEGDQKSRSRELKDHARKFGWENCVKEYLNLYEKILMDIKN